MKMLLVGMGLLVVMGAPLGLLVVGVGVLRSAMRGGMRIAVAVAGATFVIASLSFATALAHADVASQLDDASDCKSECDIKEHEALNITPVRSLGRWLLGSAVVDALLLAWWWQRSNGATGRLRPHLPLLAVAGAAAVLGLWMGLRALAVPRPDAVDVFADTTRAEFRLAIYTLITCGVGALGAILCLRASRPTS